MSISLSVLILATLSLPVSMNLGLSIPEARASCPGMTGDAQKRCECYEIGVALPGEAYMCRDSNDCVATEGACADWIAISKIFAIKNKGKIPGNRLPDLPRPAKPSVICKEKRCAFGTGEAEKKCTDPTECKSKYCVVRKATCNGRVIENPRGSGLDQCIFEAFYHPGKSIPVGCHGFLEKGRFKSRCLN